MIAHQTIGSARAETSRRNRTIIAGAFALAAMLLPNAALGMDSTPQQTAARAGDQLPLPRSAIWIRCGGWTGNRARRR
jgi:hypothetical protein